MADTKISALSAVTDLQSTDELVLARAGATKKITGANLKAAVGLFNAYALLRDEKAANTVGGAATTGSFQTRTLNTESFDVGGIVSLSSNQFTLQAGTYFVRARAPFYGTERTLLKIRNVTDSSDAVIGQVGFVTNPTSEPSAVDSTLVHLAGRFTIAGAKAFELQYRCIDNNGGNTRALGIECNFGVTEVYSEVEIWREAA